MIRWDAQDDTCVWNLMVIIIQTYKIVVLLLNLDLSNLVIWDTANDQQTIELVLREFSFALVGPEVGAGYWTPSLPVGSMRFNTQNSVVRQFAMSVMPSSNAVSEIPNSLWIKLFGQYEVI